MGIKLFFKDCLVIILNVHFNCNNLQSYTHIIISKSFPVFYRFKNIDADSRPSTAAEALKCCDAACYPNVYSLLKILCTIPVTSCECERSASALRRLHTYNRASMTQGRLSALAIVHIHYNFNVDLDEVVDKFATKHARRLQLNTLLK